MLAQLSGQGLSMSKNIRDKLLLLYKLFRQHTCMAQNVLMQQTAICGI
jgi:hypothetical protein